MLERLGPQNLVRLIMERAAVMPDQVAITTADESVTYAQLVDLTVQFARHLRRQTGIPPMNGHLGRHGGTIGPTLGVQQR